MDEFVPCRYTGNLDWLRDHTIYMTCHGSHAYGTNTESSDHDYKGIAIPPKEYIFGTKRFEQAEYKDAENNSEATVFELRKLIGLAVDCNPNIIEVLWADESDHVLVHPLAQLLLDNKDLFLSKKARHSFSGYAASQFKRIKNHNDWLRRESSIHEPTREEFGLHPIPKIRPDQYDAIISLIQRRVDMWNLKDMTDLTPDQRVDVTNMLNETLIDITASSRPDLYFAAEHYLGLDDNLIEVVQEERNYRSACSDWNSYLKWKRERNPHRHDLEDKFGYDTKHAYHLVRLMRMCREILTLGRVIVKRPDADELLSIRRGDWSFERIEEFFKTEDAAMDDLYKKSTLRRSPDRNVIEDLTVYIVEMSLELL